MYIVYTDICFNLCAVLRVSRFMQPSFCPWFSCKYFAFMPCMISDFYSYGVYLRLFDLFFSGVYGAPILFANVTTLNSLNIFNFEFKPLSFSSNSSIVSFFSPLLFFHEAACSFTPASLLIGDVLVYDDDGLKTYHRFRLNFVVCQSKNYLD